MESFSILNIPWQAVPQLISVLLIPHSDVSDSKSIMSWQTLPGG